MAIRTKRFVVTMTYEDDSEEKPYIKRWWANKHIVSAITDHLPNHNKAISGVEVKLQSVELLSTVLDDLIYPLQAE